jgi:hypothetical protein
MNSLSEKEIVLIGLVAVALGVLILSAPARSAQRTPTHVILARSCVGEAGFASIESGECAAILHVYKKRSALTGMSIRRIATRYSAAIKRRRGHPNPWVLDLRTDARKPRRWNKKLEWRAHKDRWSEAMGFAKSFLAGDVVDTLPTALHYGGKMDSHRLHPKVWAPLAAPYRNIFYERR